MQAPPSSSCRHAAGSSSRRGSHATASVSGAHAVPVVAGKVAALGGHFHRHRQLAPVTGRPLGRRLPEPCRITNTSEEVFKPFQMGPDDLEDTTDVNAIQVFNPEDGPLERRIQKFYIDELKSKDGPDLEETAYWFHTPPGGWQTEHVVMEEADEAPGEFPQPLHLDASETGRVPLSMLKEGMVLEGVLTDMWLYHGCQVDFGAEYDGLVPISRDQWKQAGVREVLVPGDTMRVRVHRILRPHLYRWPVQLELLEPSSVAAIILKPDEYKSPVDIGWCFDQGWDVEEILKQTGRTYDPPSFFLAPSQNETMNLIQESMGRDVEELDVPQQSEMEDRVFNTYAGLIRVAALEVSAMNS